MGHWFLSLFITSVVLGQCVIGARDKEDCCVGDW